MNAKQPTLEFDAWWTADEQAELRLSCSKGWANYIWQASRSAVAVDLPQIAQAERAGATWIAVCAKEQYREQCRDAIQAAGVTTK